MAAEYLKRMGERIRERREAKDLTQDELASRLPGKVNGSRVSLWERGIHRPQDDSLEALAAVLDVPVAYFIATTSPDKSETPNLLPTFGGSSSIDALRDDVRKLDAKLDAAAEEREAMQALIDQQNTNLVAHTELLAEQSRLLREVRRAVAAIPALEEALDLLREEDAAATASPGDSAPAEVPAVARARRPRRRRTG